MRIASARTLPSALSETETSEGTPGNSVNAAAKILPGLIGVGERAGSYSLVDRHCRQHIAAVQDRVGRVISGAGAGTPGSRDPVLTRNQAGNRPGRCVRACTGCDPRLAALKARSGQGRPRTCRTESGIRVVHDPQRRKWRDPAGEAQVEGAVDPIVARKGKLPAVAGGVAGVQGDYKGRGAARADNQAVEASQKRKTRRHGDRFGESQVRISLVQNRKCLWTGRGLKRLSQIDRPRPLAMAATLVSVPANTWIAGEAG